MVKKKLHKVRQKSGNFFFQILWEPCGCETIALRLAVCVFVCVCLSAMILKWHNIVNSQYIAI